MYFRSLYGQNTDYVVRLIRVDPFLGTCAANSPFRVADCDPRASLFLFPGSLFPSDDFSSILVHVSSTEFPRILIIPCDDSAVASRMRSMQHGNASGFCKFKIQTKGASTRETV